MQSIALLKSKLIMPQVSRTVNVSERIENLVHRMHQHDVVMITAPAGYGKTTLMVSALNIYEQNCRICWYRLDKEDADLAVFYVHLMETLFPAGKKKWDELHRILANCGDIYGQYQYLNTVICHELWAEYEQPDRTSVFIIFDDLQQLKDSPEIYETIHYLVNNLPGNCAVILSSRSEIDFITEKQKLEKNVLAIGSRELRFSEAEVNQLLSQSYGIKANKKLIDKIMQNTEGWAAGITMLCQVLDRKENKNIPEEFGEKNLLFKYIAFEVLKSVNTELMFFLVKAAILRDFTVAEVTTILQVENVAELLALCEKQGLFMQKIIGEVITYRFHSLFREALHEAQPQYLQAAEIQSYHLRAADYYVGNGIIDRAIEHFVSGENVPRAVELLTRESLSRGPFELLERMRLWLKILPDDTVNNNMFLFYLKSHVTPESVDETLIKEPDMALQMKTLIIISYLYVIKNDVVNSLKVLNQAPISQETAKHLPVKGMLTAFDLMKAVLEEKLPRAIDFSQRLRTFELDQEWKWMSLAYSSKLYLLLGELNTAEEFIKEAFELDLIKKTELLKGFALTYYAMILYMKDERAMFFSARSELMAIGEKYNDPYLLAFVQRFSALESYCQNDLETAMEALESSSNYFSQLGNDGMQALNKLNRCLWLLGSNNSRELLKDAQEIFKDLNAMRPGDCIIEIGQSILGVLAREAGEYEYAEKVLLSSLKKSHKKKAQQIYCGTLIHLAKLYYDKGDMLRGEELLLQSFQIAASNQYRMFWDLHPPTLLEMSARCMKKNIYQAYVLDLIKKSYGPEAIKLLQEQVPLCQEASLKELCEAVTSYYGSKNDPSAVKINVYLLGKFSIEVNGRLISGEHFRTKKIASIMKYLLVHRGQTITRECLMEVFWPGSDKKSASMSLRVALYEIRKVLTSFDISMEGKDAFIQERYAGLEIKTGGMMNMDIDEFLSLNHSLQELSDDASGSIRKTVILERMLTLYRGNLLEDEIYEDWTFLEREELKYLYLKVVLALASDYIDKKENEKAEKILLKALAVDPYNEPACFSLLTIYLSTDQRGRAVKMYDSFARRLGEDLNIKPDPKLTFIIRE